MRFSHGDRVVLLQAHAGFSAGSLGTVGTGGPATAIVDFDAAPTQSVLVPNHWLRLASARVAAAKQSGFASERGMPAAIAEMGGGGNDLLWFSPSVIPPGVGTATNFVAVTATPNLLSLLLQNVEVALCGSTTSGCWIGSLEFPVAGGPATLSVDARGFVEQSAGAKTSIFIVIGAVLKSIAFDDAHTGNFTETFTATIGAEPVQTITLILLAERPAGSDDLRIGLDSLDIATS